MKFCIAIALALSACATTTTTTGARSINVAVVRNDIARVIAADAPTRTILSMGKVTEEMAVVYTVHSADDERTEETWRNAGGTWTLEKSVALAGSR